MLNSLDMADCKEKQTPYYFTVYAYYYLYISIFIGFVRLFDKSVTLKINSEI